MAKKPTRRAERVEVIYSPRRWELLKALRLEALKVMRALDRFKIHGIVHGSIARGDVNPKSDVDVFIPDIHSSFLVEEALERADIPIVRRVMIQATPSYAVKGYVEVGERRSISFPLVKLRPLERDFYKFGGELDLKALERGARVPGVDKRLMLIEPIERGHVESSIVGREEEVARLLSVSVDVVQDRVRALIRRDEIGRTGVFLERELASSETFELALKLLADVNPAIRRRVKLHER